MRQRWFDRKFDIVLTVAAAPGLVERLRGTPARLEERLRGLDPAVLTRRWDNTWSIQENAGHLGDLEPLWLARVQDLEQGLPDLRPADLDNRRTFQANHNTRPLEDVLRVFREARALLVERLERATEADWLRSARHPRLGTPMRLLDLASFVAEHDDRHLARITELLRSR